MYTAQEIEWHLAQFFASGMSRHAYAKMPGTPCEISLRKWEREYAMGKYDLPKVHVAGKVDHDKHRRYPEKTKREARRLAKLGMDYGSIARRLGVSSRTVVRNWVRGAAKQKASAKVKKNERKHSRGQQPLVPDNELTSIKPKTKMEKLLIEELRRERIEKAIQLEVMRDPKAQSLESLSTRQKTELGLKLKRDLGYSLTLILSILRLSSSTFYDNVKRIEDPERIKQRTHLVEAVKESFRSSKRTYGYRRVVADLAAKGIYAPQHQVREVMRERSMVPRRTYARKRYSSYAGEPDTRPDNIPLKETGRHDFSADEPFALALTDITEFKVHKTEKVYLSPILDCSIGCPVSYSISVHPDSKLCDSSLEGFIKSKKESIYAGKQTVLHSDGGVQYRAKSWKGICAENDIVRSMSRKGRCGDNARMEGFFGTIKEEFYNNINWDEVSQEEFIEQLDGYLQWYLHQRLKAFKTNGKTVYDTIAGRLAKLGVAI